MIGPFEINEYIRRIMDTQVRFHMHSDDPEDDDILASYWKESYPYENHIAEIMTIHILNRERTEEFNKDIYNYLTHHPELNEIEFSLVDIISAQQYTKIPTLKYKPLTYKNHDYLEEKLNENKINNEKIKINNNWNLVFKNLAIIQTAFNQSLIKLVFEKEYKNYNNYNLSTQKKSITKYFKLNNKKNPIINNIDNEDKNAFIKASESKNKIILDKNKIILDEDENEVNIVDEESVEEKNLSGKKSNKNNNNNEKPIKTGKKKDNSVLNNNNSDQNIINSNDNNINSAQNKSKNNDKNKHPKNTNIKADKNNDNSNQNSDKSDKNNDKNIPPKITNNNVDKNNDISNQNSNKSDKNNNNNNQNSKKNEKEFEENDASENESVNGDIEMLNNVNNSKDNNINDNNNIQNDENNNSKNISLGGEESEYKDDEITCIQDLDDILNPDEKVKDKIQLIQYIPLKDDEIESWIKKYYLNGKIQDTKDKLSRDQIKFIKWKNYTFENYTKEDRELFALIDRKNYIKRNNTDGYVLNANFEYEYRVIKNYCEFFKELYPDTYESDKYLKMDYKLKKVEDTKSFDPDEHIQIKKRRPQLDDIIFDNDEDYDREDIKDNKNNNKKNNNSKSTNKKSNKNSDKSKQTFKKSTQKNQKNKQNKSKAKSKSKKKPIKKNSSSDEEDELSDENINNSNENSEDDDNNDIDENEFHTLKEIFKSKCFNQPHRINYYNTYRLYCSRILDIIFLKTCWKDFFYMGNTFRKELPMICLPCMQIYSVNGFSKHIKHCHDRYLKPLHATMKMHTKTFVDEKKNQLVKRKNHNYGSRLKEWFADEIKSKGGPWFNCF